MTHFIENDFLKVGIKEYGCEITSIISKKSGYEFLWQGNPSIWKGQSPILFPFIGRLYNDTYTLNGKDYSMSKHGFARNLPWNLYSEDEDSISFILTDNEETYVNYPYHFELIVKFTLEKNKLRVTHNVINKNDELMYFSLGAHPAFNCNIGDTLIFDKEETLECLQVDLDSSLLIPESYTLLNEEKIITVTKDIFNADALILKDFKSEHITLNVNNGERKIKFHLGFAPFLGIWAKPGAPYVCIEPWYGLNDSIEKKADLSEKTGIQKLLPGKDFIFEWTAEFTE